MNSDFIPTTEQKAVIECVGSAFVTACPGAGKTRVLVERARFLKRLKSRRGIAFLSFTEVAVSELDSRLAKENLIQRPAHPDFVGTFDSFLWRFFIASFGIPGSDAKPRLIPDLDSRDVIPYPKARVLPLGMFDRKTGEADAGELQRAKLTDDDVRKHKVAAVKMWARFRARGEIDYSDARTIALARLRDPDFAPALAKALGARFGELVVDEAQDCNPDDLEIIQWFRDLGMPVKIICDPHQSIYGFRGGVTDQLAAFAETFPDHERLSLTGNFRSSRAIVHVVNRLKRIPGTPALDEAIGRHSDVRHPVHLLFYPGTSVPQTIGAHFHELVKKLDAKPQDCPVVASTRLSSARALGLPVYDDAGSLTCRLAAAVATFHASPEKRSRIQALEEIHQLALRVQGQLTNKTYRQHMAELGDVTLQWRPAVLAIAQKLRYNPALHTSPEKWLAQARTLLAPLLPVGSTRSIAQVLKMDAALDAILATSKAPAIPARTIHSVKGCEFPAVCVVISTANAKSMLDFLEHGLPHDAAEELRKAYVGASRAQQLLAVAVPNSQRARLTKLVAVASEPELFEVVQL